MLPDYLEEAVVGHDFNVIKMPRGEQLWELLTTMCDDIIIIKLKKTEAWSLREQLQTSALCKSFQEPENSFN